MSEETKDKNSDKDKATEKRCFVMMPFSDQGDYPKGHFTKVYEQIFMPAIIKAGYKPYRVDENTISDSIINKIFEGVQNCEMALCDLSNRNPNVLYELGLRQAYNKPVVLVKDEKTENIFDVSVISTVPYNSNRLYENVLEAQEKICESLKTTGEGKETTLIQFVRAKEASYEDVKVNKDDTVNIMLQSIMKELQRLNTTKETVSKAFNGAYIGANTAESSVVLIYVDEKATAVRDSIQDMVNVLNKTLNVQVLDIERLFGTADLCITISKNEYDNNENAINNIIEEKIGTIRKVYYYLK